jgi:phosphate acetyltransferase
MQKFLNKIHQLAKKQPIKLIFPEPQDPRILQALPTILKKQLCQPVLVGNEAKIKQQARQLKLSINFKKITFLDPSDSSLQKEFQNSFWKLRKNKGVTPEIAAKTMQDINYFATMAVQLSYADGLVSGSFSSTADTIRPVLQIIKTRKNVKIASSAFLMLFPDRILIYSDCALNILPDAAQLAEIALNSSELAKNFGIKPKIALLSFSTHGSSAHPLAQKVAEATKIAQRRAPGLLIDGEVQVDTALIPTVAKFKSPHSKIKGQANILIFPNLEVGNIAYKLTERLAGAKALGAILLGLNKPANDLSRGCSVEDVINLTAITAIQAMAAKKQNQQSSKRLK